MQFCTLPPFRCVAQVAGCIECSCSAFFGAEALRPHNSGPERRAALGTVKQRIVYKLALLVHKCLHGSAPSYLTEHCPVLTAASLRHQLQSSTRGELHLPRTRTYLFGPRSFRSSGLTVWNALPVSIRDASLTLEQFKKCLKHHLFSV